MVVEKYAVYERLMKCKYGIDDAGLVLTGRGVPDRATRNLLSGRDQRTDFGVSNRGQFIPNESFIFKNTGILSRRPRSLWFRYL